MTTRGLPPWGNLHFHFLLAPGPSDRRPHALQAPRCRSGSTWPGEARDPHPNGLPPVEVVFLSCLVWLRVTPLNTSKEGRRIYIFKVSQTGMRPKMEVENLQWRSGSFLVSPTSHFPVMSSRFVPFGTKDANACCVKFRWCPSFFGTVIWIHRNPHKDRNLWLITILCRNRFYLKKKSTQSFLGGAALLCL